MAVDFLGLSGVHVLLTGASGGIGIATAREFLEQGAKVTLHYNSNPNSLNDLVAEYPSHAFAVKADICSEAEVNRMFAASIERLGPVQVLVVNHGIGAQKSVLVKDMSLDQWSHILDVNLTGSFLAIRSYMQQLEQHNVQHNVSLILLGSTAGKFGCWYRADYAATKSAMMYGLTLSLKNEIVQVCPRGRVNAVAPGWTRTPMIEKELRDKVVVERSLATSPLNKISEPEDIARTILFLASERASGNITGHVVDVNAGMEGRVINPVTMGAYQV
ncbi:hypothetical protein GGH12_002493 [Coemansia sp. RSA 1822]|nr:hypothetical protein LPJ76_002496 [Coemansia sp. RSA 638]KAJ2542954.1 hypothetical protein GGF49_002432 [Coemansia sp. RSA 1853]KAJ2563629.1 hypothetical protein GGH12_002493 [Coemansia sp. RSA 1822]